MTPQLGIYVHMHWGFNHPYAARTWTLEDWRGFLEGVSRLGYTLVQIWPMIDTMPDPPTPSDLDHLERLRQVIRMAHQDFGFTVNVGASANALGNGLAADYPFETRPYFKAEELVDPADGAAVRRLMDHRRRLLEPLREADGFWIIDSDPGEYPDSPPAEFVSLLEAHRGLLDSLRPGIRLEYWVWAGWGGWHVPREDREAVRARVWREAVADLARRNPEPWGLLACEPGHFQVIESLGLAARTLYFPYNAVEMEPSFPLTNWHGRPDQDLPRVLARIPDRLWPRGVMGNCQTHCLQLPQLYLLAHLARGGTLDGLDLAGFGNRLIPGAGGDLARAAEAIAGEDPEAMRAARAALEPWDREDLPAGDLAGLLFGSPRRLIQDLAHQLDCVEPLERLRRLAQDGSGPPDGLLAAFQAAFAAWQSRTGFADRAGGPLVARMNAGLDPFCPEVMQAGAGDRHGVMLRIRDALARRVGRMGGA